MGTSDHFGYRNKYIHRGGSFSPYIKIGSLLRIMKARKPSNPFPQDYIRNMIDFVCAGLLSLEMQGNYSVVSRTDFKHPFNPNTPEGQLYFVLNQHANEFAQRISPTLIVVQHSDYLIPNSLTPQQWAVMRNKSLYGELENLSEKLLELGILTRKKRGGFAVVYQPSSRWSRRYINVTTDNLSRTDLFSKEGVAETFSKSLPVKKEGRDKVIVIRS